MTPEELAGLPAAARTMARLCEIPSPSREEGRVAEVVRGELRALGAEVTEDGAAAAIGAGCGNIVGRFAPTAPGGTPIVLCAHLDTVPVTGPIEVELVDGHLTNRHPAILGGDDKAAVAVMLEADAPRPRREAAPRRASSCSSPRARRSACAAPPRSTRRSCRARLGFVYDHAGPIGDVVASAPSLHKIDATFVGRAAHAGIAPEAGRSAIDAAARAIARMPLGPHRRRDDRQHRHDRGRHRHQRRGRALRRSPPRRAAATSARWSVQLTAMLDALTWAASECEVDLETRVDSEFSGLPPGASDDPQVAMARARAASPSATPRGWSRAAAARTSTPSSRNGFPAVNLCNGMIDVHTPDERIAVGSLEAMLDVTLGLIDAARQA